LALACMSLVSYSIRGAMYVCCCPLVVVFVVDVVADDMTVE
jgi:hypothetical protein